MHESSGRMRVHMAQCYMTLQEADMLEYYLRSIDYVNNVRVYERTCDAVILYRRTEESRSDLIRRLSSFSYEEKAVAELVPGQTGRALEREYEDKLALMIMGRMVRRFMLPVPVRTAWTIWRSLHFIGKGIRALSAGTLEVSVLDAVAITASMLRGDFSTAGSVMFLLDAGELLEDWTRRKSVDDLARSMSLQVDRVWQVTGDTDKDAAPKEVLTDIRLIREKDHIIVRTSDIIPLDGKVVRGHVSVNQASMTGESVPVDKHPGGYVYAGTVVDEGECVIEVTRAAGSGKYDQIVRMIEESEKLKSETESKAYHLADSLVPYSLAGTAVTWLLTRDVNRALAFLMVDFSCALKLSMPLSVLSAIREAAEGKIRVKGGKFLEAAAQADTIVFDKTGTLTFATPKVAMIVTFGGADPDESLRIAACLEEHYPHSIANAVVEEARVRGLDHDEMHTQVQYVVAHGIASRIDGRKAVIGSYHFVFEDEQCVIPDGEEKKFESLPEEYSRLYLAIGGILVAVICIHDPLRPEAQEVIRSLRRLGLDNICMMTGDNRKVAKTIADKLQVDYRAEVLPEDKAAFIREAHRKGQKVIMIGDGVNDTPALSEADVGISISEGAAIAREVADITITQDSLEQLVLLRRLSLALMRRIQSNYRFIISFNSMLIILGVTGILTPSASALLHNTSTIVAGLRSMTNLLRESKNEKG